MYDGFHIQSSLNFHFSINGLFAPTANDTSADVTSSNTLLILSYFFNNLTSKFILQGYSKQIIMFSIDLSTATSRFVIGKVRFIIYLPMSSSYLIKWFYKLGLVTVYERETICAPVNLVCNILWMFVYMFFLQLCGWKLRFKYFSENFIQTFFLRE